MGKLRHGVMRSKAMRQASDPAEIRALEARDAQPMLHPPDNAASHTWEHDSPTGVPPTCNGLLTLWASTRGAAHRGSGGWQSGCCQSPLEKVSRASLQTPPAAVTFLRQRCPSTSSRTSWQSGYQRRSPQAINLWFLWPHQASVNSAELQSKWHLRIQAGCSKIHSSLGRHSLRKGFSQSDAEYCPYSSPFSCRNSHTHLTKPDHGLLILTERVPVHPPLRGDRELSDVTPPLKRLRVTCLGCTQLNKQTRSPPRCVPSHTHDAQGGLAELGGTISLPLPHLNPKQPIHPPAQMTHL